jgi:DNA-binding HxlR family transcriptional regulator
MEAERVNEYISEVPFEIRNAVKPLDNDKTWAILIALLKHDRMRFTELKETFNARSSGEVDRYLKALIAAGLVEKRSVLFKDIANAEKIYYYPTPLSKSLIRALFQGISIHPGKDTADTATDGGEVRYISSPGKGICQNVPGAPAAPRE